MKVSPAKLKERQSWPLDRKVEWALHQIRLWYDYHDGKVYVAFSGGKDSTVLLHLVRSLYPDAPAAFCNTGLEFPEIVAFVKSTENVEWLRPGKSFKRVLEEYGYPVVSKENAGYLREIATARRNGSQGWVQQRMFGVRRDGGKTTFCLPAKWHFLVDAPFAISEKCCDVMKKRPFRAYTKRTGRRGIVGVQAVDSSLRKQQYLKHGCNIYGSKEPLSRPLSIWNTENVWNYIRNQDIPYSSIYTMGYDRTGCVFCAFGAHLEKPPNRFQRLKKTHPRLWRYCMDKLGMREVLAYVGVATGDKGTA